jgi:hypothetical protein
MILKPRVSVKPIVKLNTYFYKEVIIDNSVTGLTTTGQQAADPSIVYDPVNKRYLVYFFANVANSSETYVAETRDLLRMKFLGKAIPKGGAGAFDSVHAEKASVIRYNDIYYGFYSGKSGTSSAIGVATSSDGVSFTKHQSNPILTDPEGTGYLDAPTVIRWKDGDFYMWAYNGNGKNIIFRTTPSQFPLGWQQIGAIEDPRFSILSTEAFYDDEIDRILLLANIFYPKPSGISEPARTGMLALYVCEEPLKCLYHGVLLPSLPRDTRSYPLRYCQQNVFAPGIAKVGSGIYVILFNCTEDGSIATEKVYRLDLGVDDEQTLHIINTYTTSTADEKLAVLRLPPGTKAILKHANVYAYSGTPTELYIFEGAPVAGRDNVIAWVGGARLEFNGRVTINEEYLGIAIRGTAPISIAYSFMITIKPAHDIIT